MRYINDFSWGSLFFFSKKTWTACFKITGKSLWGICMKQNIDKNIGKAAILLNYDHRNAMHHFKNHQYAKFLACAMGWPSLPYLN